VSLSYALSDPYHVGAVDPYTHLQYTSMLYAQVDAVSFAAARLGYGGIPVYVSETGWPSKGDADEVGATVENARAYNRNLLVRQVGNEGTPLRPRQRIEVYLFALFNENMKPGPSSERNYGLFKPDGTPAYELSYRLPKENTTSGAGGGSITVAGGNNGHGGGPQDAGYYSISASPKANVVSSAFRSCLLLSVILTVHALHRFLFGKSFYYFCVSWQSSWLNYLE
jgi:hypothetical protein